ncbi:MAG: hypothetical protein LBH43_19445 [Treponema sp.]|nr:hypothetical protein [Treponema sp.]
MLKKTVMLLFCLTGVLLNIAICKLFAGLAAFPLYLDTVLTISITLSCGLFWGILCGVLTNFISHTFLYFWGWEGYLFILCNAATAVITFLFVLFFPGELNLTGKRDVLKFNLPRKSQLFDIVIDRIFVITLLSFSLCVAMSILGGLIASFIQLLRSSGDGQAANPGSYRDLGLTMFRQGFPLILAEILTRIPINIIDRLISAFGGYGIALAIAKIRKQWAMNTLERY